MPADVRKSERLYKNSERLRLERLCEDEAEPRGTSTTDGKAQPFRTSGGTAAKPFSSRNFYEQRQVYLPKRSRKRREKDSNWSAGCQPAVRSSAARRRTRRLIIFKLICNRAFPRSVLAKPRTRGQAGSLRSGLFRFFSHADAANS